MRNSHKKISHFNKKQIETISLYLVDISKSLVLVMLAGMLFPQVRGEVTVFSGIIGFIFCVILFAIGIILLKEFDLYA